MEKQLLEELRVKLAKACGIAPYSIFKDEEMELLLDKKPKTISELEGLRGFPKGGARCTKWGEAIVACFNKIDALKDFNLTKCEGEGGFKVEPIFRKMECF